MFNRNNLSHQSLQIISSGLPEVFFISYVGGNGNKIASKKVTSNSEQQAFIESKLEIIHANIATWQRDIDEEPITFEGIKSEYVDSFALLGSITWPHD